MKTLKSLISGLLMSGVILLSGNVMSQTENPGMLKESKQEMVQKKRGHQKGRKMMAQHLGLTEEQKERAKEIHLAAAKEAKPLEDQLRELKAHHQTLVTAEVANMKAINKSIDEMSAVKAKLAKVKAGYHQEFRSILSEEQKLKMDRMKNRHFCEGHGRMRGKLNKMCP